MVKVKICGITKERDLKAAVAAGADLLGFVVGVPRSPRNLPLSKARYLISKIPKGAGSVAVTVFKTMEELIHIYTELETDYLQLHGSFHHLLESMAEIPPKSCIIGAVNGKAHDALNLAIKFSGVFQSVLLDTAGDGGLGGTGIAHDWYLSRRVRDIIYPKHLILAGGLTPENVGEAIRKVKPHGVDVSSGVEERPGIKDHEKMFDFVAKARDAGHE